MTGIKMRGQGPCQLEAYAVSTVVLVRKDAMNIRVSLRQIAHGNRLSGLTVLVIQRMMCKQHVNACRLTARHDHCAICPANACIGQNCNNAWMLAA